MQFFIRLSKNLSEEEAAFAFVTMLETVNSLLSRLGGKQVCGLSVLVLRLTCLREN